MLKDSLVNTFEELLSAAVRIEEKIYTMRVIGFSDDEIYLIIDYNKKFHHHHAVYMSHLLDEMIRSASLCYCDIDNHRCSLR